jgi:hypothetical protein
MTNNFARFTTVEDAIEDIIAEQVQAEQDAARAKAEQDELTVEFWAAKDAGYQAMAIADRLAWYQAGRPENTPLIWDMEDWEYREYERERGI